MKGGSLLVLGETDPDLASIFVEAADAVGPRVWCRRGADQGEGEFGCDANDVAVGGRLLDLRTPAARYEQVFLGLHGAHQGDNAAAALAAAEGFFAAPFDEQIVRTALGPSAGPGQARGRQAIAARPAGRGAQHRRRKALAQAICGDFAVDGPTVAVVGMLLGTGSGRRC